ncbi:hypothetical protein CDAR_417321 [Caerostris darwini]|uniref:Uncharacterized protein n=1 Tax=Caerostris darwini TaxID=1538125 RepID=A0AAV4X5A4_9ARAC|nr:hypothetical protein CDAR_417321 [Caerostris darwini]
MPSFVGDDHHEEEWGRKVLPEKASDIPSLKCEGWSRAPPSDLPEWEFRIYFASTKDSSFGVIQNAQEPAVIIQK